MSPRHLASLGAAFGALVSVTAACATKPAPEDANLAAAMDRHKITVEQASERLEIGVAAEAAGLTPATISKLDAFAQMYVREGHGALIMSTPAGGPNADAARQVAQSVRTRLALKGVPFAVISAGAYDGSNEGDAPVVLSFTHFDATAPECAPLWRQDLAHNPTNQPWESFGCTMQANLAAMISDPADLLGPRPEDPRDATRRAAVLEAYRQGKQTHAERSNDERVTISNAVQ